MDYFLEIRVRPDPEFSSTMLMGALFSKLHRALVALEASDVGVSFPEYKERPRTLGSILRIHGCSGRLDQLMVQAWLQGMRDHVDVSDMQPAPARSQHRVVRRRQFKTNVDRLRRRRMKRHGESYDEAAAHLPEGIEDQVVLPYIALRSQSTGQTFCLFIEQGEILETPVKGDFSRYGLSQSATVPWF